jgi:hypothetical protein
MAVNVERVHTDHLSCHPVTVAVKDLAERQSSASMALKVSFNTLSTVLASLSQFLTTRFGRTTGAGLAVILGVPLVIVAISLLVTTYVSLFTLGATALTCYFCCAFLLRPMLAFFETACEQQMVPGVLGVLLFWIVAFTDATMLALVVSMVMGKETGQRCLDVCSRSSLLY